MEIDAGVRRLVRGTDIRVLELLNCTLDDDSFAAIRELEGLEELTIHSTTFPEDPSEWLRSLRGLRSLDCRGVGGPTLSRVLPELTELRSLTVVEPEPTDSIIRSINGGQLESLVVRGCFVGVDEIDILGTMPRLSTLDLQTSKLPGRSLGRLGGLHRLRALNLRGLDVFSITSPPKLALPAGIRLLVLDGLDGDMVKQALDRTEATADLRTLSVSGCGIGRGNAPDITSAQYMEKLDLVDNGLAALEIERIVGEVIS